VFQFDRPARNADHPTSKPVELVRQQLANSTRPGDHVLDVFGGSGSTLIAAEQLGRRALVMELDPGYCDVIRRRYKAYLDQREASE
jgi:DNA modification methylase